MSYDDNPTDGQFSSASFDIRDHLDKLEPGKGKDAYTCPACQGKRLTFDKKTGAYQCWSGGCSTHDIKEAIRPLADFLAERNGQQSPQPAKKPRARKKKECLPAPIPSGAKLLTLPAPGQSPQPEQLAKDAPKRVPSNAVQITYEYSSNQKAVRYEWSDATNPKGHEKTYSQFHIDPDNKKVWTKGDSRWPAYRIGEVVETLATVPDSVPVAVLMPEGEPNVDLARSYGIAGLTMQGSNWSDVEIQIMMETLRATGKNVVLAKLRDNDDEGIRKGQKVWLVARYIQFPCVVIDPRVIYPDIPEKGDIREILKAIGPGEFLNRMNAEIAAQAQNLEHLPAKTSNQDSPLDNSSGEILTAPVENHALQSDSKLIQDYNKLLAFFGDRIRLNKLSKRIEINGKPTSIDRAKIQLATKHGILVRSGREDLQDILMELAHQNEYSPIEEYLQSLPQPENTTILDSLAERYFGATSPIYESFMRRTLISAVARALSPGCKVDTALILQGNQGFQKSTFFKVLAGGIYFDDSVGAASDKDERLKMHRAWIVEWSELETVFSRRDVSATKAFLSCSVDALRPPYHRDTQDFPRSSIIVGSTNEDEFLSDKTGNRRFWVIPVEKKIDVEQLTQERDAIWAAAVLAYKSGEQWWLTPEEETLLAQNNQGWQITDVWETAILNYVDNKSTCTITELLEKPIGLELAKQSRSEQMRVSSILRRNGWIKAPRQKRIDGKPQWYWEKVVTGSDGVVTEVVTPLNPLPARITDAKKEVSQPVTTFSANLTKNISLNFSELDSSDNVQPEEKENFTSFNEKGSDGCDTKPQSFSEQGLNAVTTPVTTPVTTSSQPPAKILEEFKVSDRVEITQESDYQGQKGEIVDIGYGAREVDYYVRLAAEKVIVSVPLAADSLHYLRKL
jgi:predicted P-loop ATPase